MTAPYLPADEAIQVARDHVMWVQQADPGIGPGALLASMLIAWPHERDPSWTDALLILAAWWDQQRGSRPYRHNERVILLSERWVA